jgi:hypothetical protein
MSFENWRTPDQLWGTLQNFDITRIFLMTIDNTGKFPFTKTKGYAMFWTLKGLGLNTDVELIQRFVYEEQL